MGAEPIVTDEARAMIGAESELSTGYQVTEHEIRRYAYAVDDLNPLWTSPEYAQKTQYSGIIAPPLFYTVPFPLDRPLSELLEDGRPKTEPGRLIPPLRATQGMAGGLEVEFFQPIRPGDTLTVKARLVDIQEREGRSGQMAFVITERTYTNQRGETVVVARSTDIAR